ncbi:hypothetical protein NL676_000480 [Syzygium grande]|nr:hypothetical protein NL676_000480 [Syzygium grande]
MQGRQAEVIAGGQQKKQVDRAESSSWCSNKRSTGSSSVRVRAAVTITDSGSGSAAATGAADRGSSEARELLGQLMHGETVIPAVPIDTCVREGDANEDEDEEEGNEWQRRIRGNAVQHVRGGDAGGVTGTSCEPAGRHIAHWRGSPRELSLQLLECPYKRLGLWLCQPQPKRRREPMHPRRSAKCFRIIWHE